ncbi:hypothetical protein CR513_03399, partial [Mucuna pruriens]
MGKNKGKAIEGEEKGKEEISKEEVAKVLEFIRQRIIGNIMINNHLTFSKEEISAEGRRHNHALHISIKCMDHILVQVLVDNGSSLNIMPKSTLE